MVKKMNVILLCFLGFVVSISLFDFNRSYAQEEKVNKVNKSAVDEEQGVEIGSIVYDIDENGNITERLVTAEGTITEEEAEREYYEKFIGGEASDSRSKTSYNKGDVNGDAKISSMDYVLVKNHILNISKLTGDAALAADVNGDGKISSMDYVLIKNHILKITEIVWNAYQVVSIDENGKQSLISEFSNYSEAINMYNAQIQKNPHVNFAVKMGNDYFKIKYATVQFKKIVDGNKISTISYTEDGTKIGGYISPVYGIDAAFLEEKDGKVKFKLSSVVAWVDAKYVDIVPYTENTTYISFYKNEQGKVIHKSKTSNLDTNTYGSSIHNGYAPHYFKTNTTYYSYDGHYFYTDYFNMIDDYRNGVSKNAINSTQPYYNYFQFLPIHSTSNYTAEDINRYLKSKGYTEKAKAGTTLKNNQSMLVGEGAAYISAQNYGSNALLTFGHSINESGWGRSDISIQKNNIFGLNAVDSSPGESANTFPSVSNCIEHFANRYITWGYLDTEDWRYFGGHLGDKSSGMNVKYASDPYWGEKAAAQAYAFDEVNGKKDYGVYTLALKESPDQVNIRKNSSTSSPVIYIMKNNHYNVRNMPVIVLESKTGTNVNGNNVWYKILTDHALDNEQNKLKVPNVDFDTLIQYPYHPDHSFGYVSATNFKIINNAKTKEVFDEK